MVLVCMRHLWTDWNLWNWFAKMGLTPYFQKIDIGSGRLQQWQGRITGRQSAWGPVISFESFWRQFFWFQSSKLRLRFMPSSLEADGVKGYFLFCTTGHMDAVVWSCGSWGWIHQSLVHAILVPTFSGSYFGPSGTARNRKDVKHNASRLFGHSTSANSMIWRRLGFSSRRWVCQIDCGRRCGNVHLLWTPSTIQCLNNLFVGTLTSVREYTALCRTMCLVHSDWSRDVLLRDTFTSSFLRMADFPRDWRALATATVLAGRFAAEWCIHIWIWCKRWTFGLNHPNPSLTLNAVITGRDDVVHYCGVWGSSRRTAVLFSSVIKVIDLYCWAWLWCLCSSMEVIVNTNFGRWACVAYFVIWHFCTTWFSGDFNDISRTDFTGDYVM